MTEPQHIGDDQMDAASGGYRPRPVIVTSASSGGSSGYTGPTLSAKGGGDVAMEELSVSHEGLHLAD